MYRQFATLLFGIVPFWLGALALADDEAKTDRAAASKSGGQLLLEKTTYKLAHAVVYETKSFDDDVIAVLLSDKPIPVDKLKATLEKGKGSDSGLFLFQPHVKITFSKEGKVSNCNAWGDNFSVSVSGTSLSGEMTIKDGRVTGKAKLVSEPDDKHKSEFDVQFDEPLLKVTIAKDEPKPEKPKTAKTDKPKPEATDEPAEELLNKVLGEAKGKNSKGKTTKDKTPADGAAGEMNVKELPIPKDATDVEYKKLVQHVGFKSPSDVKTMAAYLSEQLEKQGWKKPDSDLVTPKSAILNRSKGKAKLTIFVKPADAGSQVTIFTSGLTWEDK